jgi:DNA-binding CsgD family transcriptional regulator
LGGVESGVEATAARGDEDPAEEVGGLRGGATDPLDELDAQLSRLRSVAEELRGSRRRSSGALSGDQVELVEDGPTLARTYEQLQRGAHRGLRVLDRPPYVSPPSSQNQLELERLAEGISYRAIYGTAVFEHEDTMRVLPELLAAGEQARVLAQVPIKMAIVDDDLALIGLTKRAPDQSHLLIRSSGLLDGLIATFEMLWALAIPMPALKTADDLRTLRTPDRDVLLLLAGGATDDKISRHLHISPRTTQRRVRALMDALGAQTRFQAGVQAARRHWI